MFALCVADHCGIRHQHTAHCPGGDCRGCLPREAAPGLRLCEVDVRRIAEDARTAAVLHDDLALVLIRRGAGGERVVSSSTGAPVPDDEVMEARQAIRATLVALVRIIADERGSHLPADEVSAMSAYLGHHAVWLAAHSAAEEHARDLRDLASDPRPWRLAYPSGSDRLYVGDCPLPADGGTCGSRLYQHRDRWLIACPGCGVEESVDWWRARLVGDAPALVDAYAAAAELSARWSRAVEPRHLRVWATRDRVGRHGHDERGRTLYDLDELVRYATRQWGDPVRGPVAA